MSIRGPGNRKSRGEDGRHDCNLCPDSTKGHATALFYRLDVDTGAHHIVSRAHASHLDPSQTSADEILRHLSTITRKMKRAA